MLVKVPDRDTGGWELDADAEIGRVSSRYGAEGQGKRDPRPRWGENVVWRLASGRYAVLRGSYSVIYHRNPTTCRNTGSEGPGSGPQSGIPATRKDLPRDAIPCPACRPPAPGLLPPGQRSIRYEFPRQSMDTCDDPAAVIRQLTHHRRHTGEQRVTVSEPVRALLEQLQANDDSFASEELPMQRIG